MRLSRRLVVVGLGAVLTRYAMDRADAADAAPDYPNHTVRIIVPFPAGGTADVLPRIVAQYLSKRWNQPVVVENKTGAGAATSARPMSQRPSRMDIRCLRVRRGRWPSTTRSTNLNRSASSRPT
jgi:tripartite-type tricarboxylate transporter receptor subunit TctC